MTCGKVVRHARLMLDYTPAHPIIFSSDGRIMNGMHRVCKALLEGGAHIEAVHWCAIPPIRRIPARIMNS